MQLSDKPECMKLVTAILDYYKQPISDFVLAVWWEGCKGCSLPQVANALTRHATCPERGQFAPKVADIVKQLLGTNSDRSIVAWGKVYEAMSAIGGNSDVVFDDKAIHSVIQDMGGWPKICAGETKDLSYQQHQFCTAYKAYSNQAEFAYPRKLLGRLSDEAGYAKKGLPAPEPYFVGNHQDCQAVLDGGVTGGKTKISHASQFLALTAKGI